MLHRIAFTEREYEAAEYHFQALQRVTAKRVEQLPGFCWLSLAWADLHLTGVQIRAPHLEYYIHPDFQSRPFRGKFQSDADTYFLDILPDGLAISSEFKDTATRLYQGLRELGYFNDQRDFEWNINRGMSYEVAFLLAETQVGVDKCGTLEEKLITIGFEMQFWGMSKPFVPQSGVQSFQMLRLSHLIATMRPGTLCTRWLVHTGTLDLLLWCLCNAAGSALHQPQNCTPSKATPLLPTWLQRHVTFITKLLGIVGPHDLEARLQRLPFSTMWNGPACRAVFSATQIYGNTAVITKSSCAPNVELFRDLRLIFDSCPDSPSHSQEQLPRPISAW